MAIEIINNTQLFIFVCLLKESHFPVLVLCVCVCVYALPYLSLQVCVHDLLFILASTNYNYLITCVHFVSYVIT